jgi:hypothetical protein
VLIFEKPKCSGVIFEKPKMSCVIFENQHVQCDILPASNDGVHSGVSLFSGVYILPISPKFYYRTPSLRCPSLSSISSIYLAVDSRVNILPLTEIRQLLSTSRFFYCWSWSVVEGAAAAGGGHETWDGDDNGAKTVGVDSDGVWHLAAAAVAIDHHPNSKQNWIWRYAPLSSSAIWFCR